MNWVEVAGNVLASSAGFAAGISAYVCYIYTRYLFEGSNPLSRHIVLISMSYGTISFVVAWATVAAIQESRFQTFNWMAWALLIAFLVGDYALVLILIHVRRRAAFRRGTVSDEG